MRLLRWLSEMSTYFILQLQNVSYQFVYYTCTSPCSLSSSPSAAVAAARLNNFIIIVLSSPREMMRNDKKSNRFCWIKRENILSISLPMWCSFHQITTIDGVMRGGEYTDRKIDALLRGCNTKIIVWKLNTTERCERHRQRFSCSICDVRRYTCVHLLMMYH